MNPYITPTRVIALLALLLGFAIGYVIRHLLSQQQKNSAELKIKETLLEAKSKAQKTIEEAKRKAETLINEIRKEEKEKENQIRKFEERIAKKEEILDKQKAEAENQLKSVKTEIEEIKKKKALIEKAEEEKRKELEKIASLTQEEAKKELFSSIEKQYEKDILERIQKMELFGKEKLEKKAQEILSTTIQRLASSTASEITITSVPITSEEIKGKIIGKEGRNIKAFERTAGVEIIVDDTPGSVIISSFDPVRRQVAKMALENLIIDGRIQPARIEEAVNKAKIEIEKIIKEKGEEAAYEVGVLDLNPSLLVLLGRLHFRTSYGQNVLKHSLEMAHISGMLAAELKADIDIAKKGALLHDIGKTVDHEIQGSHVEIGRRILQKFGVDERIIKAMQAHHEEYPYETIESVIVQTADAISGSRPGARRDTIENYLKRLESLENIANSFKGVERSFAIQAGREIRIFVSPEEISDLDAKKIARDIADRIQSELKYPGEIKVHVIRETRVVEYAK